VAKRKSGFRRPTADEQTVLREMHLKLLVAPKDIQQCDQILIHEHYQVSGWSQFGHTRGWKRSAVDFYAEHGHPKQVWNRELVRNACAQLRAPELPAAWAPGLKIFPKSPASWRLPK
jgi:hypothetical protein